MEDQEVGRMGGKGPVKETVNEGEQKVGRQGGKGPGKERTKMEEQEKGRMGKGGTVKETMNKVEQKVGSQEGRKGKKCPVKGQASENSKSTPVWQKFDRDVFGDTYTCILFTTWVYKKCSFFLCLLFNGHSWKVFLRLLRGVN